ncbi:MAG: hypothetical protein ACYC41_13395 [Bacillota bacterium]
MLDFEAITDDQLRKSLLSDYQEMENCISSKAWKAAHVLAGSITEAVLVDYLLSSDYKTRTGVDPLELDLNKAIMACKKEGIINDKTEGLANVVRSYRNLIHPGRIIRLQETVDEDGATAARSLVNLVVKEISRKRIAEQGYTATQFVSKIELDSSALAISLHLLIEMKERERERLLLDAIPDRYWELEQRDSPDTDVLSSLETCYHEAFQMSGEETKAKVARRFLRARRGCRNA